MNKKIIIANWKMNPATGKEAEKLFKDINKSVSLLKLKNTEVVICPPVIYLENFKKISLGRSRTGEAKKIMLGAQNIFPGDVGAYTGEVSVKMLQSLGVKYVILGHSERRAMGESNVVINKKIKAVLSLGLTPVLCIGENERDENHEYFNIVNTQIAECLSGISKNSLARVIIAYEPVWSISTTLNHKDATPVDSKEMVIFIRKIISNIYSPQIAKEVKVIYGGSVNEKNVSEFLINGGVSGALVGGASLNQKKFGDIIKICETLNN
ncbi:MAG: triose-phosphate isomerase [Candidatus Nomurabacteria bacterium]|nr:triose-phosphate isomerase [Candidatus Nomurabacteria bacterium]